MSIGILTKHQQLLVLVLGFPGGSDSKESACNVGNRGSIPGLGRSPGGEHSNPFQYSCLENPYGQKSLGYSPNFNLISLPFVSFKTFCGINFRNIWVVTKHCR